MRQNVLDNFTIEDCCGCMSCMNACPTNAIAEDKDKFGFIIPSIDNNKCIHCGKCVQVCPYQTGIDVVKHKPQGAYAAINKSDDTVMRSSSGGIFTALAKRIINEGGIVFGAAMDKNFKVAHSEARDMESLLNLQKSKYVQSNLHNTFSKIKRYIDEGRKVLFTGTPCQVSALCCFYGNNVPNNLILVDIICHGVPNQDFFDDYLDTLQSKYDNIEVYTFRAKKKVRNGMNCFFSFKIKGKKPIIRNWPEDSFNFMYMKGMIYRDSCYSCKFASEERASDLTLCDYWGWDLHHQKDFPSSSSISGVVVNSSKGNELLLSVTSDINIKETDYANLASHNKCLLEGTPMNPERGKILTKWKNEGYKAIDDEFCTTHKKQILRYKLMGIIPEIFRRKFSFKK